MRIARHISTFAPLACSALIATGLMSTPADAGRFEALFAPSADLWERWTEHNAADTRSLDHNVWERFLKTYVSREADGINRVAYAEITQIDRQILGAYMSALAATRIGTFNRDEQRAYWINLYNALTVEVVLDHYPVETIRDIDISPGLFSDGPWDKKLIEVEYEPLSLNDIEHRILRPIWQDPRIHYAVNCASLGCPNLQTDAFTGTNADRLLAVAAREYINHPRGVRLDDGELVVSSIYLWFQEDFGDSDQGVLSHLALYADPELRRALMRIERIDDDAYDWNLNDNLPSKRQALTVP